MVKKKILLSVYNKLQEEMPMTDKYKRIQDRFCIERKKFLQNLEQQNEHTLEDLCDIIYEMDEELNKQFFYEGFSIAVKLFIETMAENKEGDV